MLGNHLVLTVMLSPSTLMEEVGLAMRAGVNTVSLGPVGVLVATATCVINGYEDAIGTMNDDVDVLERLVFGSGEADHSEQIYLTKRRTTDFRRSVVPLARGLERLSRTDLPWLLAMPDRVLQVVTAELSRSGSAAIDR
ncbi:Mg2+ and Co2+ transporter CorA [Nakamurella sp. UYEF19]|uniref:CorA family divalent cation transporter n=1 Tax=Nakamurella sp. UYEF19 TaxID=1756392 RepID=UPI0033910BF7